MGSSAESYQEINIKRNPRFDAPPQTPSNSRSVASILQRTISSFDSEVKSKGGSEDHRDRLAPSPHQMSYHRQTTTITQQQVQDILSDDQQWRKLKDSMNEEGRATTGMKLKQELYQLLMERVHELNEKRRREVHKKPIKSTSKLLFSVHSNLGRRLSALQTERVSITGRSNVASTRSLRRADSKSQHQYAQQIIGDDLDENFGQLLEEEEEEAIVDVEGWNMNRAELLNMLEIATHMEEEDLDQSTEFDKTRPRNVTSAKMA